MTQSELYKVILRGETFSLDRSQVEFDSPNYFTSCFLGSFSESHRQEIQLSRDPALFSMIVTYLSGYTILPLKPASGMSEEATLENLLRDALFYGLDDLVKMLEEYRAGDKQPRSAGEKVVKSYVMILWPVSGFSSCDIGLSLSIVNSMGCATEGANLPLDFLNHKRKPSAALIPFLQTLSPCCNLQVLR